MKTILLASVLALSLGACKKSGGDAAATGGDQCEAAIGHAIDTMTNAKAGQPPAMAEMAAKLRGVFVSHCKADKWPAEVVSCFAAASDQPSIKACRQKLPPEQAAAVQKEIMQMMTGGGGGGMMPPHGGGGGGSMGGGAPGGEAPPAAGSGSPQ